MKTEADKLILDIRRNAKQGYMVWLFVSFWLPIGLLILIGSIVTNSAAFAIIMLLLSTGIYCAIHKSVKRFIYKKKK